MVVMYTCMYIHVTKQFVHTRDIYNHSRGHCHDCISSFATVSMHNIHLYRYICAVCFIVCILVCKYTCTHVHVHIHLYMYMFVYTNYFHVYNVQCILYLSAFLKHFLFLCAACTQCQSILTGSRGLQGQGLGPG